MTARQYLERHARYGPLIEYTSAKARVIITIPAYNEPDLLLTLRSVSCCDVSIPCAVFVLINFPDSEDPAPHLERFKELQKWAEHNSRENLSFHPLLLPLPNKTAGVGMARKILMDEAVRHRPEVIVCLDADCTVQPNYLTELSKFPDLAGAAIYFEHALDGQNVEAITAYELHLRYYVQAQRWLGVPYAFHTVGSSMAVRTSDYCKTGGMNIRKAGEDFYFLQKIIPRGFATITSTTVFPSGRISGRVPFGTGKAVGTFLERKSQYTYSPDALYLVKKWLQQCLENWNREDTSGIAPVFMDTELFEREWQRITRNSTSYAIWERHFFAWFDGFKLMKALHYLRDHGYPNILVKDASSWLLKELNISPEKSMRGLLAQYRQLEKSYRTNIFSR